MEKTAKYQWAIVRYISSDEQGKKVVELANAGVGYHIMNKGRSKGEDVLVAFKWIPLDKKGDSKPLPQHLELASAYQSDRLEEWDKNRSGLPQQTDRRGIKTEIARPTRITTEFLDNIFPSKVQA